MKMNLAYCIRILTVLGFLAMGSVSPAFAQSSGQAGEDDAVHQSRSSEQVLPHGAPDLKQEKADFHAQESMAWKENLGPKQQTRLERLERKLKKRMNRKPLQPNRPIPIIALIIGILLVGIWALLIGLTVALWSSIGILFLILSILWLVPGTLGLIFLIGGLIGLFA